MNASLNEKLGTVKWGEFKYKEVFNRIEQGRRLKKDDQIDGTIPFVMSGTTNAGVVNYISNPVASFPKNAITIDIFGNVLTQTIRNIIGNPCHYKPLNKGKTCTCHI